MEFFEKVKEFFSSLWNILGTVIVGIISILGILTLVRKNSENKENTLNGNIEKKNKENKNIDKEILKVEGRIEFLGEKELELLGELDKQKKDDSKNLEDFFDKRGF